jgi:hypothetical protein
MTLQELRKSCGFTRLADALPRIKQRIAQCLASPAQRSSTRDAQRHKGRQRKL